MGAASLIYTIQSPHPTKTLNKEIDEFH